MKKLSEQFLFAGLTRFRKLLLAAAFFLLAAGGLWCAGALFRAFDAPPFPAGAAVAALVLLLILGLFIRQALWAAALLEISVAAAFFAITPQQRFRDTVWQTSWQRTLAVRKLDDGRYELQNVRNFRYRSEHDFDVRYRTVAVDPEHISSIDAAFSHWDDMEGIAHSMLGLNFDDGTTVVISLETRLPQGVEQNGLDGLYRRYELAMIGGTPNDLYELRTDHRGETLYVYRLDADEKFMRELTVSLFERAAKLQRKPEFYNSLARNCTTGLLPTLPGADRFLDSDIRLMLNGWAAKMLFDKGLLVRREGESFGSLRARSLVPGLCRGKAAPRARYGGESEARWLKER